MAASPHFALFFPVGVARLRPLLIVGANAVRPGASAGVGRSATPASLPSRESRPSPPFARPSVWVCREGLLRPQRFCAISVSPTPHLTTIDSSREKLWVVRRWARLCLPKLSYQRFFLGSPRAVILLAAHTSCPFGSSRKPPCAAPARSVGDASVCGDPLPAPDPGGGPRSVTRQVSSAPTAESPPGAEVGFGQLHHGRPLRTARVDPALFADGNGSHHEGSQAGRPGAAGGTLLQGPAPPGWRSHPRAPAPCPQTPRDRRPPGLRGGVGAPGGTGPASG